MPDSSARSPQLAERIGLLREELVAARHEFFSALAPVDPRRLTAPGLLNGWSGQELVAHLGYWTGHAIEVIQAAERGTTDLLGHGQPSVDEINATVARVARDSDLATVRKREAAAFEVLTQRLAGLDPDLLDVRLPDGATVEHGIREDGAEHYREHGAELRGAGNRVR